VFQVNAEKKYNNQSELIDDMLDNMFHCMQELDLNPGNTICIKEYFRKQYLYSGYIIYLLINRRLR
jgi:hypothetical protein